MAYSDTRGFATKGLTLKFGATTVGQVTDFSGLGGGTRGTIDITTLTSSAREQISGFQDPGEATVSGILALQSGFVDLIEQELDSDIPKAWSILIPAQQLADGTGSLEASELGTLSAQWTAAASGAESTFTTQGTTDAQDSPAFGDGDFLRIPTSGNNTANVRVSSVVRAANGALTIRGAAVPAGSIAVQSSNATITQLRPPARYAFNATVGSFPKTFSTEDVVRFEISLTITGKPTLSLGTPNLT